MIGRRSKDDEIPLTIAKSSILHETKARFDTLLLKTTRSHDEEEKKIKKQRKSVSKSDRPKDSKTSKRSSRSKWKHSSSLQKLVSDESLSTSSEPESHEFSPEVSSKLDNNDKKSNSTPKSKELLQSPVAEGNGSVDFIKTNTMFHSDHSPTESNGTKDFDLSPKRPVPLPRRQQSTREESKDTTSSRVSSPDSVMTAVEAGSPLKSFQDNTFEHISHWSSNEKNDYENGDSEDIELKPLKVVSPSYEEIDETKLDTGWSQQTVVLQNAVSYEEILDGKDENDFGRKRDRPTKASKAHGQRNQARQKRKSQTQSARHHPVDDISSEGRINRSPVESRGTDSEKAASSSEMDIQPSAKFQYSYEKVIGVTLHCCEALKIDKLIRHPMVRVHILDTSTGEYLKKSQPSRKVSFFQENQNIDYIQPLTSHPCNFKDPRSLIPIWEETLLFNEDISHILQANTSILILFEVLDCVSFDTAVAKYQELGSESGWHRIAWAFLKPRGPNNILNIDKRLRLQLYKPQVEKGFGSQSFCEKCHVYRWWRRGGWIQYPSTIFVTVHSLSIPSDVSPGLRSFLALQPEQCSDRPLASSVDDAKQVQQNGAGEFGSRSKQISDITWSRLPSQSCKVPNEQMLCLSAGINGSFSLKFSNKGFYVAITAENEKMHNIIVYKIPDGSMTMRFNGHTGLVYSLDWSFNDELVLSASADCTVCVWSAESQEQKPLQMLPHPSFVYCALFVPDNNLHLVTGCCDHVVRMWRKNSPLTDYELQQELTGHEGYISTLCMNTAADIFSGDSVGQIRVWQKTQDGSMVQHKVITVRELQGVVLSHLVLHPAGKRLLVLARDSLLRMIDIGTGVAIQWFKGALNHRIHSKASISPCGGFLFAPSEDGTFCVWNTDTGQLLASYTSLFHSLHKTISEERPSHRPQFSTVILSGAVDYHPFENMVAFSIYGVHAPVIICKYNREVTRDSIGLQLRSSHKEKSEAVTSDESGLGIFPESSKKADRPLEKDSKSRDKSELVGGKERRHISHIIHQLDCVLKMSKIPEQHQLDNSPLKFSTEARRSGSISSKLSHRHSNFEDVIDEVETNGVTYSLPKTNVSEQQSKHLDLDSLESSSHDNASSGQIGLMSPAQVQYVQERKSVLPAPRKKKLKQTHRVRQSIADLSSTDTSIMSSDHEEITSASLKMKRDQIVSISISNDDSRESKVKSSSRKGGTTDRKEDNPLIFNKFLSFDSDSNINETKMKTINSI